MDNSPYVVGSTTAAISLAAGEFRVYGNKPSTLSTKGFEAGDTVGLYPNPTNDYFSINTNTQSVEVYSVTGQLVKTFSQQQNGYQFNISDLARGVYMVKAKDENQREKTMKLVKQ